MTEPFKPVLRLIMQTSVPVEDVIEGEELYRQLGEMLKNYGPEVTVNGQILKMLEPCCKKKRPFIDKLHESRKEKAPDEKAPETAQ